MTLLSYLGEPVFSKGLPEVIAYQRVVMHMPDRVIRVLFFFFLFSFSFFHKN